MHDKIPPEEKLSPAPTEKITNGNADKASVMVVKRVKKPEAEERVHQHEVLEAGTRALTERAGTFLDVADQFSSWVKRRAPYGGFNVGEKIEQSDEFRSLRGSVEILNVEIPRYLSLVKEIVSADAGSVNSERVQDVLHRALDDLRNDMAKAQRNSEDLYGIILRLKKKIIDYHDGNESEDEEYLASLIPIIRDVHEGSRQLYNECRRQQELIASLP